MEHKASHLVSMPFISRFNVYHLVFFVIGISLGVVATLCFNSLSFSLQSFLYPMKTPITTLLPPSSPLKVLSNTNSNSTSTTTHALKRTLIHNMTDQELFLKASEVVSGIIDQDVPNKAIPKVAFMFLAKGALPLAPLWENFFKGHAGFYSIYLHQHPSFNETFPRDSVFYGRKVPSQVSRL